jgi:WD40 repeat protein
MRPNKLWENHSMHTRGVLWADRTVMERREGVALATWEVESWDAALAYSPDGTWVVLGGAGDGTIRVRDTHNDGTPAHLEGHAYAVNSVAFSPNGARVASGSCDHIIRL